MRQPDAISGAGSAPGITSAELRNERSRSRYRRSGRDWLKEWRPAEVEVGDEIRVLAAARDRARRERRWSEADRLRTEINTRGYTVADTPDGPILNRK